MTAVTRVFHSITWLQTQRPQRVMTSSRTVGGIHRVERQPPEVFSGAPAWEGILYPGQHHQLVAFAIKNVAFGHIFGAVIDESPAENVAALGGPGNL